MSVTVEFHYDFGSPNTYYCHKVIPAVEQRTGARFHYFPILLGGVFKATNNKSPMEQFAEVLNKKEYNALETERFVRKHKIEGFHFNPNFPVNTLLIMRGACYASEQDYYDRYIETMYQGMWEKALPMDDPEVVASLLTEAGLPARDILDATQDPEIKQRLIDNTRTSVEKGTFGSPTFYVGEEIFFGKDKIREVEEEILTAQGQQTVID